MGLDTKTIHRRILIIVPILAIFASLWGVFANSYQDHPWAAAQLKGQDVVTMIIGLIFLITLSVQNIKVSFVQLGFLGYFVYTYITYALGPAINVMFFVYVPVITLSILELVILIMQLNQYEFIIQNKKSFAVSAIYLFAIGLMLAILWISDIIGILRGQALLQNPTGKPLVTVYVLDLGFIIPLCIIGSIQLFRHKQAGILISGFLLVKSTTLGIALNAMTIALSVYGFAFDLFLAVFWGILGIVGFILSWLFMAGVDVISINTDS